MRSLDIKMRSEFCDFSRLRTSCRFVKRGGFLKLILVCGHYGCGKTNFSINLASGLSRRGKKRTVLVDMDIVNPYFRSGDYEDILKKHSVELIAPVFSATTVDAPCISPRVA